MPIEGFFQDNNSTPLSKFKEGLMGVKVESLKIYDPAKPPLYRRIEELSNQFPQLSRWFWVMCGSKHEAKNVEEVKKSMNI